MVKFDEAQPKLDSSVSSDNFATASSNPFETTDSTDSNGCFSADKFNFRFFNFNMGNNQSFSSLGEIQGPAGHGSFNALFDNPFSNGSPVDVAFVTLVETRLTCGEWIAERARKEQKRLQKEPNLERQQSKGSNKIVGTNARRQSRAKAGMMRGFVERLASSYNGNLKSLIACDSNRFEEDTKASLFGRLTEVQIRGITVPNPKKAFVGRSFYARDDPSGIRFCLVGAHFPITSLACALDDPGGGKAALDGCKQAFGRTLRKILVKASRSGLLDERTVLIVQGDLNSRTVLGDDGKPFDVLLELLRDGQMQAELCAGLNIQSGRWHEICSFESPLALPVTYKFASKTCPRSPEIKLADVFPSGGPTKSPSMASARSGSLLRMLSKSSSAKSLNKEKSTNSLEFERATSSKSCLTQATDATDSSSIGDASQGKRRSWRAFGRSKSPKSPMKSPRGPRSEASQRYRDVLQGFGSDVLNHEWALNFDAENFKTYRFPASADRVIYWAPDCLAERMEWILPHGGYEVNNSQLGSDHKPVSLEAVLRISRKKDEDIDPEEGLSVGHDSPPAFRKVSSYSCDGAQSQTSNGLLPPLTLPSHGPVGAGYPRLPDGSLTSIPIPCWLADDDVAEMDEDSEDAQEGEITTL